MAESSTTTLVIKFLDTVNTALLMDGPDGDVFQKKDDAFKQYVQLASKWMTYPLNHPLPNVFKIFAILRGYGFKLQFIFDTTTPAQIAEIIGQVVINGKQGGAGFPEPVPNKQGGAGFPEPVPNLRGYSFSNFFTYFKIVCPSEEKAQAIQRDLAPYILINPVDYFERPLDTVYIRAPSVLASSLGCIPDSASEQDFWKTLGIYEFWANQNPELYGTPSSVTIHEIENAWMLNDVFNSHPILIPPSTDTSDHSRLHGCAILGLLKAPWLNNSLPNAFTVINGIVPMAQIKLYSSATTDVSKENDIREDDMLAQAMYQAKTRPGDVILLEKELLDMPKYDVINGVQMSGGNVKNFPLELDQLIFELMQVATHGLGLLVIEPAGSGNCELDEYECQLHDQNKKYKLEIDVAENLKGLQPSIKDYLNRRFLMPYSRYIGYDLKRDSGAIMVGATFWREGHWQNNPGILPNIDTNYGKRVDTCGPGEQVLTTYAGSNVGVICHTSAATAVVAGMVAALQIVIIGQNNVPVRRLNRDALRILFRQVSPNGLWSLSELDKKLVLHTY